MPGLPVTPELLQQAIQIFAQRRRQSQGDADMQMILEFNQQSRESTLKQYRHELDIHGREGEISHKEAEVEKQRAHSASLLQTRLEAEKEKQERDQAFQLQRIAAKERVGRTPTSRARLTGPRPSQVPTQGTGIVTGPAGPYAASAAGPVALSPEQALFAPDSPLRLEDGQYRLTSQGGGFGASGMPSPDTTPLMDYLESRRHEISPDEFEGLISLGSTGQLTTNQFVSRIEDAAKQPKHEGRSERDLETNIARLEFARAKLNRANDPENTVGPRLESMIRDERRKLREMQEGTNPQRGQTFTSNRAPTPGGKWPTDEVIDHFLDLSEGDTNVAEQMARDAGYAW